MHTRSSVRSLVSNDMTIPILLAVFQLTFQMIFHGNYGYFRDELYYIACSNHLAFGYVDQPPLSIAILWISRALLGDSLQAIRFLPSLAGASAVILAALMARRLGGGRFAQGLAALSVVAAPVLLGNGRYFSMNAFDVLFWVLAGYTVTRIFTGESPKAWLLFGAVVGLGLLNKYSMGFLCIGLVVGLLPTSHRKQLATKWFWLGALIAFLIFLPHIIWEIRFSFPTLDFIRNANRDKNVSLTVFEFMAGQLLFINYFNGPLFLLGLYYFFFHQEGKRYRPLAWMYIAVLFMMIMSNAKVYYLSPIYPILFAGGAVSAERLARKHSWNRIKPVYLTFLIVSTVIAAPFALPVLPVEEFIVYQRMLGLTPRAEERNPLGELPQSYADEFGWEEMVATVASVYRTLTPEERAQCVIYARDYGQAGAIDFFGRKYGLPNALCGHNSYWLWGPGERTGNVAIIFGGSRDLKENLSDLNRRYSYVEHVATTHAQYAMPFENGRLIFLCKGMNTTFQKLWPEERFYI